MPRPLLIFSQSDYKIGLLLQIHILNGKQCRSRSVGFFFRSQLIWIYTVCKGKVYPGSAGQGLIKSGFINLGQVMRECPKSFLEGVRDYWQGQSLREAYSINRWGIKWVLIICGRGVNQHKGKRVHVASVSLGLIKICRYLGPVFQSVVSLTSSLRVISLTV